MTEVPLGEDEVFEINITLGSTADPITAVIVDGDNEEIDLSGWTIVFRMVDIETGIVKINNAACTVNDRANGKVSYSFTATDINTEGCYQAWFIRKQGILEGWYPGGKRKMIINVVKPVGS